MSLKSRASGERVPHPALPCLPSGLASSAPELWHSTSAFCLCEGYRSLEFSQPPLGCGLPGLQHCTPGLVAVPLRACLLY